MTREKSRKVKTIEELAAIIERLKADGKVVVMCHGVFDMLHPGHMKHFEAAKDKGDVLIVTLTRDEHVHKGPGRPVFKQDLRAESIAALEVVDYVAVNEWPTAVETIRRIRPSIYVKGSDYAEASDDVTGKIVEEEEAVRSVGGMLQFTDEITFSSSALINRYLAPFSAEAREFLDDMKGRHSADEVISALKSLKDLRVLVVGDVIVDEYCYVAGMGKAQKDNIIATRYISEERFAGGVLAAVNHVAGFCENVTLVSCLGTSNDYGTFVRQHIAGNVDVQLFEQSGVPTVVKRRFLDPTFLTKLFEICYLADSDYLSRVVERSILAWLAEHVSEFDVVLVADFGHGMVTPRIRRTLEDKASFLALNVQSNSANLGFNYVTKYRRADYICIDEPEVRLACHDRTSNVENLIVTIGRKLKCDRVVITRGHKGSIAYDKATGFTEVPVLSAEVVDRIGAGDAFSSITAPCVKKGLPMDIVGFVGNAVGAMQVLTVGNRSAVDPTALFKYVVTLLK
ncbi:MAG: cytidyltransferase [Actinobacteria bacterium]|nr:MAG: cytidyltransferase [Actinomycetota bacterium]